MSEIDPKERAGSAESAALAAIAPKHPWHMGRMVAAWGVAAAIGVTVTVLFQGEERFLWLVFAIGVSTLVTFALQLGTAQRVGFITRTAYSVAGSVVIIAVIDLVGVLIG